MKLQTFETLVGAIQSMIAQIFSGSTAIPSPVMMCPKNKMSPTDKGMHYGCEFEIMSGVVKLMVFEFSRLICTQTTILH